MTVKELIAKLEKIEDQNALVYLGVEGYSTNNSDEKNIGVYDNGNYVFVCDGCYYEEVDG